MYTVKVTGLNELDKKIKALDRALQQKAMQEVAAAGAQILLDDMRANVARDSGDLARDLKIQPRKTALQHEGLVQVGPDRLAWRARFLEKGTSPHIIEKKNKKVLADRATGVVFGRAVRHRGARAEPFIQPALFRNRERVLQVMREALIRIITTTAQRG